MRLISLVRNLKELTDWKNFSKQQKVKAIEAFREMELRLRNNKSK